MEDLPRPCDVAILMNVCHHLTIPQLAHTLADLLGQRVARARGAGLLVVELRTLAEGERRFLLWTPPFYRLLFCLALDLEVRRRVLVRDHWAQAYEATLIRWRTSAGRPPTAAELERRLWELLPLLRSACVRELNALGGALLPDNLDEYWRQKRVGFLCAQLAWIAVAEADRGASVP